MLLYGNYSRCCISNHANNLRNACINHPDITDRCGYIDFTLSLVIFLLHCYLSVVVFVYSYYSETSDQISINGWSLVVVSVSGWSGQCCCSWWGPLCNSGQCNGVHYMLYRCNTVHQALSQDINIAALTFPQNNFIDKFLWLFCVE